jgi:hypothetical protein
MELPRRKSFLAIVFILVALLTFGLFGYCISIRGQANEILATAFRLTTSNNRAEDFFAIQHQYGRRLRLQGCNAQSQYCDYEIKVSNRLLSGLKLAPYTELTAWFTVRDGRVITTMLEYRTALKQSKGPVVHVQTDFCNVKECGWVYLNPWSDSSELRFNGIVEMGYTATMQRRQQAYALNVRCLYSVKGGKDIAALLPTVWTRTANGNVASLIPNKDGASDWCKEEAEQQVASANKCR